MDVLGLIKHYQLKPRGVIQVGSHHGEEIPMWNEMGVKQVHFEPVMKNFLKLQELYPYVLAFPVALGDFSGEAEMHTEDINGGQSCSLLRPKSHLELLPWIDFNGREKVTVHPLDDYGFATQDSNFIYMDVQGYELQVLRGGRQTLRQIDFIFTEVNKAEVFEACAQIEELDYFLLPLGFRRVATEWHGQDFGDALYVK